MFSNQEASQLWQNVMQSNACVYITAGNTNYTVKMSLTISSAEESAKCLLLKNNQTLWLLHALAFKHEKQEH